MDHVEKAYQAYDEACEVGFSELRAVHVTNKVEPPKIGEELKAAYLKAFAVAFSDGAIVGEEHGMPPVVPKEELKPYVWYCEHPEEYARVYHVHHQVYADRFALAHRNAVDALVQVCDDLGAERPGSDRVTVKAVSMALGIVFDRGYRYGATKGEQA